MSYLKTQKMIGDDIIKSLEKIFDEITNSFSSILSVRHVEIKIDDENIIKDGCQIPTFHENVKYWFMEYDILIFPAITSNIDKTILAASSPCMFINGNTKPIAGIVLINQNLSLDKKDFEYRMKNILFHELTHIIGFHPIIFENLKLISTKTINGQQYSYINSKKVLEKAKLHFGCDNIEGIQLENQGASGTIGSHWETRYMLGDYMIGSDYSENVISDITLALLEDTGLYKVNYYSGGLFRFGKNQGCAFLNKKCLINKGENTLFPNEFCVNVGEAFCGGSHIAKGDCYIVRYNSIPEKYRYFEEKEKGGMASADYCPVSFMFEFDKEYFYPKNCRYGKEEFSSIGEIIGENSMCFESSLLNSDTESICYKMECDKQNKKINVYINDAEVICPGYETILNNPNGLRGKLKCPDYNLVCTSDTWCNEMFECIDKKSTANSNSYEYISNPESLHERDKANLLVDDNNIFESFGEKIIVNVQKLFLLFMLYINF